jgi:thioredoxin-like negative regulator of GroEL
MPAFPRRPAGPALALAALALGAVPAAAQEVRWRHDYAAARREARAAGRPLVLDFGTAHCVWCTKLDATTFRDPALAKLLNDRYVPVKVDGDRDATLAMALHISNFPTLVFAAPDGKILGVEEGYVEAGRLTQRLQRVLAACAPAAAAVPAPDRAQKAPETPAAGPAADLAAARRACDDLSERLGELYLRTAEECLKHGQPDEAAACLERVAQVSPGSRHAAAARERLAALGAGTKARAQAP